MQLDVIHELDQFGIEYTIKDGYAQVICPFHGDTTPSGNVSVEHGGFKCFSCGQTSDFVKYLAGAVKQSPALIKADLQSRYGESQDKTIDIQLVEQYHKLLLDGSNTYLMAELAKRKVPEEVIKQRRLGAYDGRIIIPVYNKTGYVVNLRKHRPGGAPNTKVVNQRGHGKPVRIYPVDQLQYDKVALCGGELKALAAMPILNQQGIGAVAVTAGEGNWEPKLSLDFKDKTVYIIYDVDKAGVEGAEKVAMQLYRAAREVHIVLLPLDTDVHPKGDVNDFLADGGDLLELLGKYEEPWVPHHKRHELNGDTSDVSLASAVQARYSGRRVRTDCVISAIGEQPYIVPKKVLVECKRDQEVCTLCSVFPDQDGQEYDIHPEAQPLLSMVDSNKRNNQDALKECLGIPSRCKAGSEVVALKNYHIEEVRISPKLEIASRDTQREMLPAYVLNDELVLNETYTVEGRLHPHPDTQASTLLISNSTLSGDALSQYQMTDPHSLKAFQPEAWELEALEQKLDVIYDDIETNVTQIYKRRTMHVAIDLAYHSPLFIKPFGKREKGWTEVLILGDSANGKSEAFNNLMDHYGLGEKIDCKNATVAGLLGGLQQFGGKKWYAVWGMFPNMDKRLICLEELKGMPPEVFAKLTDMRSSGRAEIPKIEKRRTQARTRVVALTNPPGNRTVSSYGQGVLAIQELIPSPEDIRRFDLGLVISNREVDPMEIVHLQSQDRHAQHIFTASLCQKLVLWAWTLHEDDILFEDPNSIRTTAMELWKKYDGDKIPLVDRGSTHLKVARLAAAIAARTFSHEDGKLIVRKCHVEYIAKYIDEVYSGEACGYAEHSDLQRQLETVYDEDRIRSLLKTGVDPLLFCMKIKGRATMDAQDVRDFSGLAVDAASDLMSHLVRLGAFNRQGPKYVKTQELNRIIDEMMANKELDADDPPHIKQDKGEEY